MKFIQILGTCAVILAVATSCKREPEATPGSAPVAATATPAVNPVDATAAVDNTPAADGAAKLDTKALAGRFDDGESVLELRANGSYVQTLQAGGNAISTDGSWSAVDGDGLLLDPNSKSAEDVRFQVVSKDELRNGDGNRTFRRITGQ
ncbi:MAG: hypothetical protein ABI538_03980 [Pseudoxanthomonas sp.]